uniref:Uncharacterized protein n=1 Tax=Anguilla anguilla TaxID=7936 RepID=A0A0E9QMC7_ANGAN
MRNVSVALPISMETRACSYYYNNNQKHESADQKLRGNY